MRTRTFKACACPGHVFECRIRGLRLEELGQIEGINVLYSDFAEGRLNLVNLRDELGMRLSRIWRSQAGQIP
jgi:hypothetical protein